jgi:hypothetical protein
MSPAATQPVEEPLAELLAGQQLGADQAAVKSSVQQYYTVIAAGVGAQASALSGE